MTLAPRFMWAWPSPLVELLGAVLLWSLLVLVIRRPLVRLTVAMVVSLVYERFLDGNGWSLGDVAWRAGGLVLCEVGLALYRRVSA